MFISKFIFNFYVEDPSNYDEKFQRIRIRKLYQRNLKKKLDIKNSFFTLIFLNIQIKQ